ncbi:MAG: sigma 54-interacting transcriptional regulator [Chitinophagaceae bacterium]
MAVKKPNSVTGSELLQIVSKATSALTGQDFILELARGISTVMGMRYCFVSVCADKEKTRLRTLAFVEGEKQLDNVEYNVNDSGCRMMMNGQPYFLPEGAHVLFAGAKGIEAYVGAPVISPVTGEILGHIAATDPQPVTDEKNQTAVLTIFAARIAAELERMKAEEELKQKARENEFFSFTLNQLREAVFWVTNEGKIWQVNSSAADFTGYDEEDLLAMNVSEINTTAKDFGWDFIWDRVKKYGKVVYDARLRKKNGSLIDVEVTQNHLVYEGQEYTCSIVRNLQQRKLEEELLRTVSEATSGHVGQDYFRELTRFITMTLGVKYSFISECANEEKTRLRTISFVDNATPVENIEYDLEGTPCKIVMKGKDYFCPAELEKLFPREKGLQSYLGVPIYSPSTGEVMGHLAALDDKPMTDNQNQLAILKIFAARAGSEMERMKAEEKLKKTLLDANYQLQQQLKESEERFRDLFDEAPIAYVNEGLDSKFIRANKTAIRTLGIDPSDVSNTYGFSLIPDTPEAQKRVKEAFESIEKGIDTKGVVLELRRKDNGKPLWIQWWSRPDPGGQFTRTMFVDITEQVLMEQEKNKLQAQNQYLQEEIKLTYNFDEIISKGKDFQRVLKQIEQVATTDATVLILGESGTGKELIARAIHNVSNRSKKPLVKVNCATLPANLIESELFGHEKGAFTGALDRKIGRFELADGGTIFLDEIGELPVELQAKLLRVLQEGEFERLGNPITMRVNVRVIAATNRNLAQAIEKKEFREDLYYRLNVFPILCPPLRDRKEDIPLLVKHFCQKHEGKIGRKITAVDPEVMQALMEYNWPGNVRELENIIERALILSRGDTLEYGEWIPVEKVTLPGNGEATVAAGGKLQDVEKEHILAALKKTGWKVSGEKGAARILGLNPTTLEARMKKLGIKREK